MNIDQILSEFASISLEEMNAVRLMNRTDTKFVTSRAKAMELLQLASKDYYVQEIDSRRIGNYYTVYFDTPMYDMFRRHQCGYATRQKLRIRSYVDSNLSFLEVKTKDNHARTRKKRITMPDFDPNNPRYDIHFGEGEGTQEECSSFVGENLQYDATTLSERIENRFHRITLVNKDKTERLTIDFDVNFNNLVTGNKLSLSNVVIIELKRDGLKSSPILDILKRLRIKPLGFSKYCLGTAFTHPSLPRNCIKQRLRKIEKLQNNN